MCGRFVRTVSAEAIAGLLGLFLQWVAGSSIMVFGSKDEGPDRQASA
jgi:hypothetical protein